MNKGEPLYLDGKVLAFAAMDVDVYDPLRVDTFDFVDGRRFQNCDPIPADFKRALKQRFGLND